MQSFDERQEIDGQHEPRCRFASKVGEKAEATISKFDKDTKFRRNGNDETPKFSWNELRMGKLLGKGGFNSVFEVYLPIKVIQDERNPDDDMSSSGDSTTLDGPYAIKSILHSIKCHRQSFLAGAVDLVYEAKLLSVLNHENIIKVHGLPSVSIAESYLGGGYFIILDRLAQTLEERIDAWKNDLDCSDMSASSNYGSQKHKTLTPDLQRQIDYRLKCVAIPVAEAMKYLHSNNVIFRDLKPSNIGFNEHGTVKLFDFGLAREITDPTRLLTGCTGSRRYMAPEVALNQFYGLPADVYSFGITLWEIVTLIKPYGDMNRSEHTHRVAHGRHRPCIDATCGSASIQKLMRNSWDRAPEHRPDFAKVVTILQQEIRTHDACGSNGEISTKPSWYNRGFVGFFRGSPSRSFSKRAGACAA